MKCKEKYEFWEVDEQLFNSMRGNYQSPEEKEFFEKLYEKQSWDCTIAGDLLLHENDNEDRIYIVRNNCDEYVIGQDDKEQVHVMNLTEALNTNLKEVGFLQENITLWDWLRKRNYKGMQYDHNYDFI